MTTAHAQLERPLPHYLEAERGVLATILVDNSALVRVLEKGLKGEDFFLFQNRMIFESMLLLDQERKPIDLLTVQDELNRQGKLQEAGGVAYVAELYDGMS